MVRKILLMLAIAMVVIIGFLVVYNRPYPIKPIQVSKTAVPYVTPQPTEIIEIANNIEIIGEYITDSGLYLYVIHKDGEIAVIDWEYNYYFRDNAYGWEWYPDNGMLQKENTDGTIQFVVLSVMADN